ncbi:hypothetical protein ES703_29957 [subsurface metagenome]
MRKKKSRNKQNNEPGPQGMFYAQKLCPVCKKLIVASNPKSYNAAQSELGRKMLIHKQECQKEKQLELSLPGREDKQSQTIKKLSLTGEEK